MGAPRLLWLFNYNDQVCERGRKGLSRGRVLVRRDGAAEARSDAAEEASGHPGDRGFGDRRRSRIPGLGGVRPAAIPRGGLRLRPLESGKYRHRRGDDYEHRTTEHELWARGVSRTRWRPRLCGRAERRWRPDGEVRDRRPVPNNPPPPTIYDQRRPSGIRSGTSVSVPVDAAVDRHDPGIRVPLCRTALPRL